MLYFYGDESNTPGHDQIWAIGFIFTSTPAIHMRKISKLRKECSYEFRELKYASTDYSQILFALRVIDYFLETNDLYFKIIIKDNEFFNNSYFRKNKYKLNNNDMAYLSAYSELLKSINPIKYEQNKKLVNIDDKGFRGNVILPKFLKEKDESVTNVYRRDSKRRKRDGAFCDVSNMIQLADFLQE